ncbi:hypothetical protein SAMN05660748_0808 [Blastococcus aggregatus]|uniref:Uncharacterized protein n=1 Tax=Blastococcus aggregatus TaxID=38502 RepID=A0A285V005_9ACTN|nr:hypothetical protein [Blastococcus aggregatus]SOC47422.1 hypothetical protein SAMN05660748_0808 [Blastococcus aggregatus]
MRRAPWNDQPPAPDDVQSLLAWRRTGLVLGWAAPVLAAAAGLVWLVDRRGSDEPGTTLVVLTVGAALTAVLALVYLRRVFSSAETAGDLAVVRVRRWSDGAVTTWGAALLLRVLFEQLLGLGGAWLDAVTTVLGTMAVTAYVWMLLLTTRWHPALSAGGDQL